VKGKNVPQQAEGQRQDAFCTGSLRTLDQRAPVDLIPDAAR
jgi:hypothetical protein